MSTVGYARVSTDHQSLDAQRDALIAAGCDPVFTDQMSGVRDDRPGLAKLLEYIRAGDTVVVVALDRLGRSLSAVIRTIEKLTERGVLLRSLREGIDYSTPTGRMLAGIFAALAGYERELMHERAAAARQAAPAARPAHRPATAADPGSGTPSALAARRRGADQRPDAQLRRLPRHRLPGTAGPGRGDVIGPTGVMPRTGARYGAMAAASGGGADAPGTADHEPTATAGAACPGLDAGRAARLARAPDPFRPAGPGHRSGACWRDAQAQDIGCNPGPGRAHHG